MTHGQLPPTKTAEALRIEAEKRVSEVTANAAIEESDKTEKSALRLLHKLQVHQLELELQNEELINAHATAELAVSRYTELYDFAPISYLTLNSSGNITEANLAASCLLGSERSRLIGKRFGAFVAEATLSVFNDFLMQTFATGDQPGFELELLVNDKISTVQIEAKISDDGLECRAAVIDITDKITIRKMLSNANKLESIGLLAGGIAHDFNNILAVLFGNIEIALLKLQQDHPAYRFLKESNNAMGRATNLTKQLLTFSKGGNPTLETENLKKIIEDTVKFDLHGSNIKMIMDLPDNLWKAKIDKGQISQVFANLTINAKQAMPNGGALYINAENINDIKGIKVIKENTTHYLSGNYVKVSIKDEGEGISAKNLENIFDPYFTTKNIGSGLGLSIVNSIVTKHNGYISIDSQLKKGTTFTLYFPADISSLETVEANSLDDIEKEDSESLLGHILVMDDDEDIRELMIAMIEPLGYKVDSAADGKEAIEKYIIATNNGAHFDIVIMDLTVPGGMGGKSAVKKLLVIDPKAKVIVSSGYSTDHVMSNFSDYGFKGQLVKPFKIEELIKELTRLMQLE